MQRGCLFRWVCEYLLAYACIWKFMYTCMYASIIVSFEMHICIFMCKYTCNHVCVYVHMRIILPQLHKKYQQATIGTTAFYVLWMHYFLYFSLLLLWLFCCVIVDRCWLLSKYLMVKELRRLQLMLTGNEHACAYIFYSTQNYLFIYFWTLLFWTNMGGLEV